MGSAHDIMQTFACRDINALFSRYDGWECMPIPPQSSNPAFRITRNLRGQRQNIYLVVSFEPAPLPSCIDYLQTLGKGDRAKKGTCLLVPQGTDISGVPSSIKVLPMTAFGFVDDELRWLTKKKNAVQYASEPEPATPSPAASTPVTQPTA
jgi:hypothetical protein